MEENKKPENPSVFPLPNGRWSDGMTLRDYFAAKVIQVYVNTKKDAPDGEDWDEWYAKNAYITADAMLKQREL